MQNGKENQQDPHEGKTRAKGRIPFNEHGMPEMADKRRAGSLLDDRSGKERQMELDRAISGIPCSLKGIGPHERAFCDEYSKFIGSKYCICLANGTVTLQCALQAVGVVPGDEVIVPGLTWVATAQAALDIGANVVLVDVDPQTLCLDPKAFEAAITPRTKAVIPVHLYGCMCDMDEIMRIARKHNIKVVEDVAHQQGSAWRGVRAGAIGDAGSYSFQQSKILTSGEGGAVTCNDTDIYKTVFALKQVGWTPGNPEEALYDNLVAGQRYGHNYRITEMQCVLLRGGLSRLPEQTAKREENAAYLTEELAKGGGPLQAVKRDPRVSCQAYYAMTFSFDPEKAGVKRETYLKALAAEKLWMGTPYWPVYRAPLLNLHDNTSPVPFRDQNKIQDYKNLCLPNVERAVAETAVVLSHQWLLGDRALMDQLLLAIGKVNDNLSVLKEEESSAKAAE